MTAGTDIAAEIKAAYAEAGAAVGSGELIATIKRKGAQTGPDYAPVYGPDTLHSFTVLYASFDFADRADTAVLSTDVKFKASVGDVVPAASDTITVQGVDYQIYRIEPKRDGGTDLNYMIWARA